MGLEDPCDRREDRTFTFLVFLKDQMAPLSGQREIQSGVGETGIHHPPSFKNPTPLRLVFGFEEGSLVNRRQDKAVHSGQSDQSVPFPGHLEASEERERLETTTHCAANPSPFCPVPEWMD